MVVGHCVAWRIRVLPFWQNNILLLILSKLTYSLVFYRIDIHPVALRMNGVMVVPVVISREKNELASQKNKDNQKKNIPSGILGFREKLACY